MRAAERAGLIAVVAVWSAAAMAQVPARAARAGLADTAAAPVMEEHAGARVSPTNVDLRALKPQLDGFQDLLNRGVQQAFGDQPFSILQDAKGSYIPGYGVAFSMEVNLHPLRLITPFDMRPYSPDELAKARDTKLARIRQLKAQLTEMLLKNGASLSAMAPEQNITLVVHLFNLPSESRELPSQISISVDRRMLLDLQGGRMTADDFRRNGTFVEF